MRLPLGILSGIGFIGAGTIIKRQEAVEGLTTAATLWFVTVSELAGLEGRSPEHAAWLSPVPPLDPS
jgi:putative Mg2+ transporter-C (MgtC) family protein